MHSDGVGRWALCGVKLCVCVSCCDVFDPFFVVSFVVFWDLCIELHGFVLCVCG